MRFVLGLFALCACLWGPSSTAHGHGFGISQLGNQIVANSGYALHPDLFRHDVTEFSPTDFSMNHGLFSKTASPTLPNVAFGGTDTFRFDLVGPLLYSDGIIVTPAMGVTLDADHSQSPFQNTSITGSSSGITPGYAVSATSSHHVTWSLSGATVPRGAYGAVYRISGLDNGNPLTPFEFEDVMLVMDTQNTTWGVGPLGTLADAQEMLYQFAMVELEASPAPEPTTLTMALVGLVGWQTLRRKRAPKLS